MQHVSIKKIFSVWPCSPFILFVWHFFPFCLHACACLPCLINKVQSILRVCVCVCARACTCVWSDDFNTDQISECQYAYTCVHLCVCTQLELKCGTRVCALNNHFNCYYYSCAGPAVLKFTYWNKRPIPLTSTCSQTGKTTTDHHYNYSQKILVEFKGFWMIYWCFQYMTREKTE